MERIDIYHRAPGLVKDVLCNLEGLRIERLRYGSGFDRIFRDLVNRSDWPTERIIDFRNARLRAFVSSAYGIPFYRERFHESGITPTDINSVEDLAKLRHLNKDEARERIRELQNPNCHEKPYLAKTGGTTGAGLHFFTTIPAVREQWALWWRYRQWHGITRKTWCGYFGARAVCHPNQTSPPFWRVNHFQKQILFSGHHLSPSYLSFIVEELRRRRPTWLHGFPTLLATVANYMVDCQMDLGYQIQNITIGAENLTENQIGVISQAFGVAPRQHYGMAEAVANFSECERGNLHIDEDYAAVELAETRETGVFKIFGTNLSNPMTPFIRYEVGDLVTSFSGVCACSRPGRVVGRIHGRIGDYIRLQDGRMFGPANVLFSKMTNVRSGQIVQEPNNRLIINIVRAPGFTPEDERNLKLEVDRRLGSQQPIRIEYVTELRKTAAGKTPVVIRC